MRNGKLLLLMMAAAAVTGCKDETGLTDTAARPAALVRFINATIDTGTVDFRFVDRVENLPTLQGVAFRATSGFYQRVEPGTRPVRIFPSSSSQALATVRLVDTTVTLEASKRYTMVYVGRASGNQDRLLVLQDEDTPPTPAAGNIAIRALHIAVGVGNVDVYMAQAKRLDDTVSSRVNPDPVASPLATITNVPYLGRSAYVNLPARTDTLFPHLRFAVTPAGSTTPLFLATPSQPGERPAAGSLFGPQPGTTIAGSVMTALIFSGSVTGTRQSVTANRTPTVVLISDKVLNP